MNKAIVYVIIAILAITFVLKTVETTSRDIFDTTNQTFSQMFDDVQR